SIPSQKMGKKQNSKMGLLTRFFEITGHSYPSFFSIRHDGSIGTSFGKNFGTKTKKLKKVVLKYFLDVLSQPRALLFGLILRDQKIFFLSLSKSGTSQSAITNRGQ